MVSIGGFITPTFHAGLLIDSPDIVVTTEAKQKMRRGNMTVRTLFPWTSAGIGILVAPVSVFSHDGSALWFLREEKCSPALPVDWILCQLKVDSLETVFSELNRRSGRLQETL